MLWNGWKNKNIENSNTWYLISKQSMTHKWIKKLNVMHAYIWCLHVERDQRNCLSWAGHTNNTKSKGTVHYCLGHDTIMAGWYWHWVKRKKIKSKDTDKVQWQWWFINVRIRDKMIRELAMFLFCKWQATWES